MQAALRPQGVQTAGDLELRGRTDVALEDFAIIADSLDDVIGPLFVKAEVLADALVLFLAEKRLMSGLADFSISSTLALVMPKSSAVTSA